MDAAVVEEVGGGVEQAARTGREGGQLGRGEIDHASTIPICIVEGMTKQIGVLDDRATAGRAACPASVTVLAAAAFVLAWSSGFTIAAVATVDAPATTLLVWRFLPLAVLLVVVAAARGRLRGVPRRRAPAPGR